MNHFITFSKSSLSKAPRPSTAGVNKIIINKTRRYKERKETKFLQRRIWRKLHHILKSADFSSTINLETNFFFISLLYCSYCFISTSFEKKISIWFSKNLKLLSKSLLKTRFNSRSLITKFCFTNPFRDFLWETGK